MNDLATLQKIVKDLGKFFEVFIVLAILLGEKFEYKHHGL